MRRLHKCFCRSSEIIRINLIAFVSVLLLQVAASVSADGIKEVLIEQSDGCEGLDSLIAAELEIAGFTVLWVDSDYDYAEADASLPKVACMPSRGVVEVLYTDMEGEQRAWITSMPEESSSEQLVAIEVAEGLRMALRKQKRRPSESTLKKEVAVEPGNERPVEVTGTLSGGVQFASMDVPPSALFSLLLKVRIRNFLGIGLSGMIPLAPSVIKREQANAEIRSGGIGAGLGYVYSHRSIVMAVSCGYSLWFIDASTRSGNGYTARGDFRATGGPFLRPEFTWFFSSRLGLYLGGFFLWNIPGVEYRFAGRPVATFGHPNLQTTLGLSVYLFN